jgi:hypothetical protein
VISRRRLLGGLGAAGIAGVAAWGLGRLGLAAEIASVLHRRLGFLTLDDGGVRAFAKDQTGATFAKRWPTWNRLRYHFLSSVSPSFKRYYRSTTQSRIAALEDNWVSAYLLSSDFFLNGADESRIVRYVAFYDPLRPCQNPFARPVVVR